MKTSHLISLIVGAVVLVAGGLAVLYLGDTEEQASGGQTASSAAVSSGGSEGAAATQAEPSSAQTQDSSEDTAASDDAGNQSSASPAASDSGTAQPAGDSSTQTAGLAQDGGAEEAGTVTEPGAPIAPSFDVVRVERSGDTVLAGRAEPNSKVTILDNGKPIGTVTADGKGEWVFLPESPLAPGSRELSLESENANGLKVPSEDVVVMLVPEPKASQTASSDAGSDSAEQAAEQPLAVLQPREGGGSEVLQVPKGEGIVEGDLVLEAVDYGDDGEITVSGRAMPGSTVRLYLDNELVGEATPGEDGRWSYRLAESVPYGVYQLRADQVDASGAVQARVETPFSRVEFARAELPDERFVIVQPGNSLWRIARSTLGEGVQYTVIYAANADQIRDPNLIYPGQIFAVPQTN